MKNGIKIVAALAMAFTGLLGTTAMVNHVAATTAIQCGCGDARCGGGCRLARRSTCRSCNTQCGCVQCPQCDSDVCRLELEDTKVKKTCFKVEQKVICVPAVRMPWQKCCPPGSSKTRTINVLKKHSYECPKCAYKWSVQEPVVTADDGVSHSFVSPGLVPPAGDTLYQPPPQIEMYQPVPQTQPWNAGPPQVPIIPNGR